MGKYDNIKSRMHTAGFECWHPDGRPFTPEDYRKAGMPVPTPEQLAHWAEMDRRFPPPSSD